MKNGDKMSGGECTVKINKVCPMCFSEKGFSIVLAEEKEKFFCPKDARHQFKLDKDGFLEISKTW